MGLIKTGIGASGGVLADRWKEIFCCGAPADGGKFCQSCGSRL